jgi:OOP family OmpA-OmpF porin
MIRHAIVLSLLVWAPPAQAIELALPATARQTAERNTGPDRYNAPVGVFRDESVRTIAVEGDVRRGAWRLDQPGLTAFQVMRPLRAQLEAAGYEIVLDCDESECGGFDFRFATETLPAPNMYVNIRSFHFVTALRGDPQKPDDVVTVLTSTSATSAYVQVIEAGAVGEIEAPEASPDVIVAVEAAGPDDLAGQLLERGHVTLSDLDFGTGSSDLGAGPFASLRKLSAFLKQQPDLSLVLVGHSDSVGGLESNVDLSRKRAQSVRQRLLRAYDVDGAQVTAQGAGFLAPVASNLTERGREANRRVEAVVISRD